MFKKKKKQQYCKLLSPCHGPKKTCGVGGHPTRNRVNKMLDKFGIQIVDYDAVPKASMKSIISIFTVLWLKIDLEEKNRKHNCITLDISINNTVLH